jgi:citrate synthase
MRFFEGFHHNAHPMAMMVGVVGSLSAFYHDSMDISDPHHREISAHRLLAKIPTIAAAVLQARRRRAVHVSAQSSQLLPATFCT